MEIRHLRLVKTVAEAGNLTSAGRSLFLSQSALSHQLRELEEQFGTALFQRINKRMVLTQAGERVLQTAERVLCELTKVENEVRRLVSGETGLLRLSTECYTVYHWLPNLLKSYHRHYPNVDVQIVAECTREPLRALMDGRLDLAIVSCLTPISDYGQLQFVELFTDDMAIVTSSEHPFANLDSVTPQDIAGEHLLCYTAPNEHLDIFQRVLIPAGLAPKRLSKIQLTEAIIEMVKANLGIAVMARWAIKPYLKSKRLVAIPVANHALKRAWYAVAIKDKNQPRYIQCFIKHMLEHPIV